MHVVLLPISFYIIVKIELTGFQIELENNAFQEWLFSTGLQKAVDYYPSSHFACDIEEKSYFLLSTQSSPLLVDTTSCISVLGRSAGLPGARKYRNLTTYFIVAHYCIMAVNNINVPSKH